MNLADHGVRKYDSDLGRFICPDAMWEKYISYSPYHYCRNNPISSVDFNGLAEYRNEKGELIINTDDGSKSIFIVTDQRLDNFIKAGERLADYNLLDDPKTNKEQLQSNALPLSKYQNRFNLGIDSYDSAFKVGYEQGFDNKNSILMNFLYNWFLPSFSEVPVGGQLKTGYQDGKKQGYLDKSKGNMNLNNILIDQFKSSKPIIKKK